MADWQAGHLFGLCESAHIRYIVIRSCDYFVPRICGIIPRSL